MKETTVQVRCTHKEKQAWQQLAAGRGTGLSEYLRALLNGSLGEAGAVEESAPVPASPSEAALAERGKRDQAAASPAASPTGMDSGPRSASAACRFEYKHHLYHGGKPCPQCNWPLTLREDNG